MGNICRSPMAERLFIRAVADLVGPELAPVLVYSHSAGTGGWHAGQRMQSPSAIQLRKRGADDGGFKARKLLGEHIDAADLILTAGVDQMDFVLGLRPDAARRTFLLGEFGRLLGSLDPKALPPAAADPEAVYARGVALVAAADAARDGASPRVEDELDDPYGRSDAFFTRVADEIEDTVRPLAEALLR
jgi:protein-tyrosine phosphatase